MVTFFFNLFSGGRGLTSCPTEYRTHQRHDGNAIKFRPRGLGPLDFRLYETALTGIRTLGMTPVHLVFFQFNMLLLVFHIGYTLLQTVHV